MTEHGVHIDPASLPADSDPDRPRLAVGEPIDPDDVEPVCPRRFGRLCVDTAEAERLRAALANLSAAADVVADQNRAYERTNGQLRAENREHEQRAEMLRRQVAELQSERDLHPDDVEWSRTQLAGAVSEAERLRAQLAERTDVLVSQVVELERQREELRGIVRRLVDAIYGHCDEDHGTPGCPLRLAHDAEREAGLA